MRSKAAKMVRIVIVGAGGHASDVADLAIRCGYTPIGVVDDDPPTYDRLASRELRLIGRLEDLPAETTYTLGIGYPEPRANVVGILPDQPHGPLIDPSAVVSPVATLGEGTQIFWQSAVSPLVQLHQHVLISYGSTVGHDTEIGSFTAVMPGCRISGDVTIGERVLVGTGAVVLQGVTIQDGAQIGAGAVVTRDVPAGRTVVGVPAS